MTAYEHIIAQLHELGIEYEEITHPPVTSCEDSARYRAEQGWTAESGALGSKCILFHAKGAFHLVVTHADRPVNARRFKKQFGTKNIRFATPEEVTAVTGCTVGSMPPFGHMPQEGPGPAMVYADSAIMEAPYFMCNPADPGCSLRFRGADYPRLLQAQPWPARLFTAVDDTTYAFVDL